MKKQLTIETIQNELKGASLFFHRPAAQPAPPLSPSAPEQDRSPDSTETWKHASGEVWKRTSKEPRILGNVETAKHALVTPMGGRFNLDETAANKYTLAFTTIELEALEDLKLDLRRTHGIKVAKNDLVRCALHRLVEDYHVKGTASILVSRIRKKRGR